MEPRTRSVQANGLRFSYLQAGEGPLALALHGFPDHARSFRHQMPVLAAAGYRVVVPYMRGYAPTEVPTDAPFQVAALAQDALALIDALSGGDGCAVLLGHDWGAAAAHTAAAASPEKIAKLITLAVPHRGVLESFVTNPEQQRRSWYMFFFQTPFAEQAVAHDDFAFLERLWREWSPGWNLPAAELESVKETFRQPGVLAAALSYYRHTFAPVHTNAELERLQASSTGPIRVPTLYLHGERDGCIGPEVADGVEAGFSGEFRKAVLPGAGHFLHQEAPDAVNRLILEFLGSGG